MSGVQYIGCECHLHELPDLEVDDERVMVWSPDGKPAQCWGELAGGQCPSDATTGVLLCDDCYRRKVIEPLERSP